MKKAKSDSKVCEEARGILTQYMEEQGMRKTPERYAILECVMKMPHHHTADQVLEMMPSDFRVSRGSVYNTLHLLDECGLVYTHQIAGSTYYEKALGVEPHHHYICTGCGKINDVFDPQIEIAASKVKTPRFKKIRSSTYIYGLCNLCQAKLARVKKKMEREKEANMTREEKRFARIDEELAKAAEWFK